MEVVGSVSGDDGGSGAALSTHADEAIIDGMALLIVMVKNKRTN